MKKIYYEMNIPNFDDIFKPILFYFWLIGIPAKDKIDKMLGLTFAMTAGSLLLMIIGELSFFLSKISSENFLELTALAPCTGNGCLSLAKLLCIAFKRRKVFELYDSLKKLYQEILLDDRKRGLVVGKIMIVQKFSRYYDILNGILITIYNFAPIIVMLYDYIMKGELIFCLPYSIIVPFPTDTLFNWLMVYIFSSVSGFISVLYYITVNGLYYKLSIQVCCNFTVLSDEIQRLKRNNDRDLSEFVKKHQYILKLSEDLEEIFNGPNFYNVLFGSIEICAIGFNLMAGEKKQIPGFLLFLLSQLLQIFVMSVLGENLIRESRAVAERAFLCEWYNMNRKSKKTLLLIMIRASKPQTLTAYKFSTICYESFTKIIGTSWSYFTLLRTVYYSSASEQTN